MELQKSKSILAQSSFLVALHWCLSVSVFASDDAGLPAKWQKLPDKAFFHALECYKKADWKEAVAAATESINKDPNFVDAIVLRAQAYERLSDFRKAVVDYNRYLKLSPPSDWALWGLAHSYFHLGQYAKAVDTWTRYAEVLGLGRGCLEERADAYALSGQYDKAILDLNTAVPLPHSYSIVNGLKMGYGLATDAVKDWDARIRKSPDRPQLLCGRAICWTLLRHDKEAEADASSALALNSKLVEAYQVRALSYAQQKNVQNSLADIDRAIKLSPDSTTNYIILPQLFIDCQQAEQGVEDINRRLSTDTAHSVDLLLARAELSNYLKRDDMALADVSKAIKSDPLNKRAYYLRASIYQELGKPAEAAKDYSQYIRFEPAAVKAYSQRAACYVELKQYQNAVQDLTKLIGMHEIASWHLARARCYDILGERDLASQDRRIGKYLARLNPTRWMQAPSN